MVYISIYIGLGKNFKDFSSSLQKKQAIKMSALSHQSVKFPLVRK